MDIKLDLKAICLTCLCVPARTLSVLTKDLKYDLSLLTMISKITAGKVTAYDGLPDKICYSCAELLRSAYGFQQTCTSSYNTLWSYTSQSYEQVDVKSESEDHLTARPSASEGEQTEAQEEEEGLKDPNENSPLVEISKYEGPGSPVYLEEAFLEDSQSEDAGSEDDDHNLEIEQLDESIVAVSEDDSSPKLGGKSKDAKARKEKPQCPVCKLVLSRQTHLKRHMLTHSQEKPYQCSECSKSFARSDNLWTHMLHHSSERPFGCVVCKKQFKRDGHLKTHLVRCHKSSGEIDQSRVCPVCNRYYALEANLKKHMETCNEASEFVCTDCGKQFSSRSQFANHRRTHVEVRQKAFLCTHCGKAFSRKDFLTVHMRRHRGENPYKCRYCEKAFPRTTDLRVHENYHTNKKTHHCLTCGKSFFRRCSLRIHMNIHTGERPHKCPYCPKQFIQSYDLQTHIRRHTGERFQCDMCEEKFIHAYQLNQHSKSIHSTELDYRSRLKKVSFQENQTQLEHQEGVLNE